MNTNLSLTKTQTMLLEQALQHPVGRLSLPETLRGGARQKVLNALAAHDLIDADSAGWYLTATGYAVLGHTPPKPDATGSEAAATASEESAHTAAAEAAAPEPNDVAPRARKTRDHTKQATVIQLLQRPEGATLEQLVEATGWMKHTVRGYPDQRTMPSEKRLPQRFLSLHASFLGIVFWLRAPLGIASVRHRA